MPFWVSGQQLGALTVPPEQFMVTVAGVFIDLELKPSSWWIDEEAKFIPDPGDTEYHQLRGAKEALCELGNSVFCEMMSAVLSIMDTPAKKRSVKDRFTFSFIRQICYVHLERMNNAVNPNVYKGYAKRIRDSFANYRFWNDGSLDVYETMVADVTIKRHDTLSYLAGLLKLVDRKTYNFLALEFEKDGYLYLSEDDYKDAIAPPSYEGFALGGVLTVLAAITYVAYTYFTE